MARAYRICLGGATYHLHNRGIRRDDIFLCEKDFQHFLKKLKEEAEEHNVEIHAYCLMNNHFHILATTLKPNLSEFMHGLETAYARHLARAHNWVGHVFAGRFSSHLIRETKYLYTLIRYIHLNPVKAAMVVCPEDYHWSSYRIYVHKGQKGFDEDHGWLEKEMILSQFSVDKETAVRRLERFVLAGMKKDRSFPKEDVIARAVMGSEDCLKEVRELIAGKKLPSSISGRKMLQKAGRLMEVYEAVTSSFQLECLKPDPLDFEQDRRKLQEARNAFILLAREHTVATNGEIARALGDIKEAAVSKQYGKLRKEWILGSLQDPVIKELWERFALQAFSGELEGSE